MLHQTPVPYVPLMFFLLMEFLQQELITVE